MATLGSMIQIKRKELGLSQEQLAEKIGKTAGYIGQIEREISNPSYATLLNLIEVLALDVQTLFSTADLTETSQRLKNEYNQIFSRLSPKQQQLALGMLRLISKCDF